ncbi:efflux RND transporter periplasmic adaptor subunit [Pseudoxanthomonas japonensis]|uniref:efflux RND transporter periplasmic adaptor subunit n=1 Tax=Pseudoxanthomonas japonensis TaxID=69284 RepID=UPI000DB1DCFD|nr:efflux RND transporter periplasmic adaptor subunit [Pseudoxanthomonas japonensis]NCT71214.1 efflux RND transporter periplasmic adaptor subunit [Xanthomonadaceae bacterium]PZQ30025.1 MAG: efflux transporter periplasmic adaptor subunit [Stenotrophomonas acidaminiphila]
MTSPIRSLALASALLAVLAACSKPEQQQMPPPEVVVMAASPQDVPLQRDLVGRLSPIRSSDVRARVPGVVQKRVYQEGSDVREGQVLFLIDPAPLQASLSAAQATLASAQATYANAKVAADRARQLAPQKFVSRSDLDNAEAAERSAAAAVQQARANVESARINLGYASVTAPISGRAGKQQVTEGALVGQGDATLLTTIDQIDSLYANFSMSSSELQTLRQAQGDGKVQLAGEGQRTVQVILPNGQAIDQTGTLDFSDTVVDPATGSVSLRATVPNADRTLLPGTFVTLRATLGEQKGAFLIPQGAIQRDTVSAYAMVIGKDGNVVRKNVTTQQAVGPNWLVTDGLAAGDQVIVEGLQKVKEGAPAKGVTAEQAAAAKAAQAKPAQAAGKAE